MLITSNTIVKNGMPFIDMAVRNAQPYMNKMFITVSEKSNDGTWKAMKKFQKEFPVKVHLDTENVSDPSELTEIRQRQLDMSDEGWIMFLDADDIWFPEELNQIKNHYIKPRYQTKELDGLSVSPYQVVTEHYHDDSWRKKSFTKFFRKQKGVHYRHPWPRDLIYKDDELLYWKKNKKVPHIPVRFFHVSNLMKWRFRDEPTFAEYTSRTGALKPYDGQDKYKVLMIYDRIRENK